jgi:DNA polymerase I-like protein with 3'-5' exonuclease and polymerase domains
MSSNSDFPRFSEAPRIAFDTETTGLVYPRDRAFGFSIALPDRSSYYYDIRHQPQAIDWFNYEISKYKGTIICHNAAFDYKMADNVGIYMPLELLDDTVIRACMINEHENSFSLDALCEKYLGRNKETDIYQDLARLFGGRATRNVQMKNIHRAPPSVVGPYATVDAELTLLLWEWQEEEIERQKIRPIIEFERRVMRPIIKAQMRGIRVDLDKAEQAMVSLSKEITNQQSELNNLVGMEINVDSPKQVKTLFNPKKDEFGEWVADNGIYLPMTDAGNPSMGAEVLRTMEGDRRAELIMAIRSTTKTRDTFLAGHVLGHAVGDRVYPNINQNKGEDAGTGTGRLSYTDPALQQIPSRNVKVAAIVKSVFLPDLGDKWVSLDMNSFEVRVFAHLVNNAQINATYAANELTDFHATVAKLANMPRNASYSGEANAKQLNLSMIFNSGNGHTAMQMGMPWEWNSFTDRSGKVVKYRKAGEEALKVIEQYHTAIPGVKELADKAKKIVETHGFIMTKHGRKLRFPNFFKAYKASGLAIQATAADISKEMWLLCDKIDYGHQIMSVHDSFELNVREDTDPIVIKNELQEQLREAVPWMRVPLVIDLNGQGLSYWDAQS